MTNKAGVGSKIISVQVELLVGVAVGVDQVASILDPVRN